MPMKGGILMRIDGSVYNHLSANLIPKKRNLTHKSSELKEVYKNMAKYNKNSPLYSFSLSEAKQSFVINIKEAAHTLQDITSNFSDNTSDIYTKKTLFSNNSNVISGAIKSEDYGDLPDELNFKLSSLATEQINVGNYIVSNDKYLSSSSFNFVIHTNNTDSHFRLSTSENDTNLDVQNKICEYINNRDLGMHATVLKEDSNSSIMLSSTETGNPDSADGLYFTFECPDTRFNLVEYLGLNNVSNAPTNAVFSINNEKHESTTNHISINQAIELDFHTPSDEAVKIRLIPDTNIAMEQIDSFIDAYNSLVNLANNNDRSRPGTRNLLSDISGIVEKHKIELGDAGLTIDASNHIIKDIDILNDSVKNGNFTRLFNGISSFKDDIAKTTARLTLDPMAYINKLIVTYPNIKDKARLGTPYTKSLYSGLIYNNYA